MQVQFGWREKYESIQGLWRERLNCFYSDNKYVSDLHQFNFYMNKGTRESEVHDGEKLQKPLDQSFFIKNAFQQLWDDDVEIPVEPLEFDIPQKDEMGKSIIYDGQPIDQYRSGGISGFVQKRPSSVRPG